MESRGFRRPWMTSQGHFICSKTLTKYSENVAFGCFYMISGIHWILNLVIYSNKNEALLKVTGGHVRYTGTSTKKQFTYHL